MDKWQGLVKEYKNFLPVEDNTPIVTLNEGHTPLIYCETLSKELDINLYVKYEGQIRQALSKIVACAWQ